MKTNSLVSGVTCRSRAVTPTFATSPCQQQHFRRLRQLHQDHFRTVHFTNTYIHKSRYWKLIVLYRSFIPLNRSKYTWVQSRSRKCVSVWFMRCACIIETLAHTDTGNVAINVVLQIASYSCIFPVFNCCIGIIQRQYSMNCLSTQIQTTFYFPNHMIMTRGNTCTDINGLTNNNKKWRLYFNHSLDCCSIVRWQHWTALLMLTFCLMSRWLKRVDTVRVLFVNCKCSASSDDICIWPFLNIICAW